MERLLPPDQSEGNRRSRPRLDQSQPTGESAQRRHPAAGRVSCAPDLLRLLRRPGRRALPSGEPGASPRARGRRGAARLRALSRRAREPDLEHTCAGVAASGAGAPHAGNGLGPARAERLRPGREGPGRRGRAARQDPEQRRPGRPEAQRHLLTARLWDRHALPGDLPTARLSRLAVRLLRQPSARGRRRRVDCITSRGAFRRGDAGRGARDGQAERRGVGGTVGDLSRPRRGALGSCAPIAGERSRQSSDCRALRGRVRRGGRHAPPSGPVRRRRVVVRVLQAVPRRPARARERSRPRGGHVRFFLSTGFNHGGIFRRWTFEFAHELQSLGIQHRVWASQRPDGGRYLRVQLPAALEYAFG